MRTPDELDGVGECVQSDGYSECHLTMIWHLPALAVCRHERRPPEADPRQNFPNTVMDHKQTSGPELIGLRAAGLHLCTIEVLDQRGIADRFPVRYRKTLSLSPQLLLGDQALDEFGPFL